MAETMKASGSKQNHAIDITHAPTYPGIEIRDTGEHPDEYLTFTYAEFNAFIAAVKAGEFDALIFIPD
jgi:hypothetical protein